MAFEDQMARANSNQADVFGKTDAVVKFVLEGHDRGVNWRMSGMHLCIG